MLPLIGDFQKALDRDDLDRDARSPVFEASTGSAWPDHRSCSIATVIGCSPSRTLPLAISLTSSPETAFGELDREFALKIVDRRRDGGGGKREAPCGLDAPNPRQGRGWQQKWRRDARRSPEVTEKPDDMMCSRKKISLLQNWRAIVSSKNKSGRGGRTEKEHRSIVETRKGTKTNRGGLAKGNAIPRAAMLSRP